LSNAPSLSAYQSSDPDADDFNLDFSAILKVIISSARQNIVLIGTVVLAVVALGAIVTMLITPEYEAKTQILIEDKADEIIQGGDLQDTISANGTERFLQTQLGIIQSRSLALSVVQAENLNHKASFFDAMGAKMPAQSPVPGKPLDQFSAEMAANLLLSALTVEIPVDSRIATITIATRSPQISAQLANRYAERFIDYSLNQKYGSSSYAREFLSQRLTQARAKLTQSERNLNAYASAAGLIRLSDSKSGGQDDSALSVTNSQLIQLNNVATTATAERIAAEDRWKTIQNKPVLTITEVISNSAVNQLMSAKARAEADLAEERSQHLDGYASVKAKQAQIAELDRRINAIGNSIKNSVHTDYQAAVERENSLRAQVATLRDESLKEQGRGVQYSILKREADTDRALYDSLLARYNQISASAGASSNNVTIVDRAVVPGSPSFPKFWLNIAVAFLLGLILAIIAVVLKELLDDAIRSPNDVEKKLGLPMLGLIPLDKSGDLNDKLRDGRSDVSEAYRTLVTNLTYSTQGGIPKVLTITSSRESEGKSTTSQAIAADLAALGKRVLLVDADLRRPTLHRALGTQNPPGLTDYLVGARGLDEITYHAPDSPNLSYVTALPIPPDPSLLLAGERLTEFVNEASAQYDSVIFDCPPLLGLSDVPLVAQRSDAVLFVIDASTFHRGSVKSALRRLAMANVRILGVVLNRFEPKSGTEDYSYYTYNYYNYRSDKDAV